MRDFFFVIFIALAVGFATDMYFNNGNYIAAFGGMIDNLIGHSR